MEWILKPYKSFLRQHPTVFENVPFVYLRDFNLANASIEEKSMQLAYGIDMMFRDILPRLAHGNDGLIFTSLDGEYICGTDRHMYFSSIQCF
jgi:mRNA guanylyltransferase